MLLYFAVFSIVSARERRWFWATMPSKTLVAALTADALVGTVLTFVGLPGLMPLPWWQTLAVFALCDGRVPCRERRREGRDDQMARSYGGGLETPCVDVTRPSDRQACLCNSTSSRGRQSVTFRIANQAERNS